IDRVAGMAGGGEIALHGNRVCGQRSFQVATAAVVQTDVGQVQRVGDQWAVVSVVAFDHREEPAIAAADPGFYQAVLIEGIFTGGNRGNRGGLGRLIFGGRLWRSLAAARHLRATRQNTNPQPKLSSAAPGFQHSRSPLVRVYLFVVEST